MSSTQGIDDGPRTATGGDSAAEIDVVVNGEPRRVPQGTTISSLLGRLGLEEDRVAVELNRSIARRPEWNATVIEAGARLEIVQFVGGG